MLKTKEQQHAQQGQIADNQHAAQKGFFSLFLFFGSTEHNNSVVKGDALHGIASLVPPGKRRIGGGFLFLATSDCGILHTICAILSHGMG